MPLRPRQPFTGFPFDDLPPSSTTRRSTTSNNPQHSHYPSAFQSRLDDIAQRYPDFAGDFPSFGGTRSHWGGGGRRAGDWAGGGARRATGEDFPSSGGARFGEEFGFPEDFNERFSHQYYPERQQTQSPPQPTPSVPCSSTPPVSKPPTHPNTPPVNPSSTSSANSTTPRRVVDGGGASPQQHHIQQSNTVDLGQPTNTEGEVVGGGRNQRSMSAPPDSRNSGPAGAKRYVSSVHIPVLQQPTVITAGEGTAGQVGGTAGGDDMGTSNSTPQQQQQQPQQQPQQSQTPPTQQNNRPNERVIPIHVEGRDEPVIPKHHQANFNTQSSAPSNERLFGQKPTTFTQFLNKNDPQPPPQSQSQTTAQEDLYRQQQADYQRQQQAEYQRQQQANYQQQQQQQQANFQQQQKANQQQQQPGSNIDQQVDEEVLPRPQITKPSPLEMIQSIQKDVSSLMMQVERFNGKPRDKEYIYLDEMLTRNLLKLDNIETEGKDTIRQARKEAIKCIESCIGVLEAKANANAKQQQAEVAAGKGSLNNEVAVVEQKQVGQGDGAAPATANESMMVSGVVRSGSSKSGERMMGEEEEVKKSDSKVMETSQE